MNRPPFREGLTQLGDKVYAYLQPDGGLGLSNAGLVAGRGAASSGALLIDTFFDLAHTRRLLDAIARQVGAPIRRVLNTHANGDHCWGNQLVRDAEIIGHRSVPGDMAKVKPASLQAAKAAPDSVPVANAWRQGLARFDFTGVELTPPTTLIDESFAIEVDGVPVEMLYVGPAHTEGDVIAFLPRDGVVFTGDILFRLCAPISWEGTTERWIQALERIAKLDADTIVPGHGPVCGREGALEMRDYLVYVRDRSRELFARGVPLEQAAVEIDPGPYAGWAEGERIVFQVARAYRELRGEPHDAPVDLMSLAALMVQRRERGLDRSRGSTT